jgi:hypothetical protein
LAAHFGAAFFFAAFPADWNAHGCMRAARKETPNEPW